MRIFLSHASEQSGPAERLAIALRGRGHTVFLDRDDLPPASDYQSQIQAAINDCDLFCFLISPQSVAPGRFTLSELGFAKRRWRNPAGCALPIMVEKVPIDAVPAYLRAVSILTPEGDLVADAIPAIEQLRPRVRWRTIGMWGGVGVILVLAGFFATDRIISLTRTRVEDPAAAPEASLPSRSSTLRVPATEKLQDTVGRFSAYLKRLGFRDYEENVTVYLYSKDQPLPGKLQDQSDTINAFYYDNGLYIHWSMSSDMTVLLREFMHHVLLTATKKGAEIGNGEIESSLADYFPASFLGSPLIGEGLGKLFQLPTSYLRKLDNRLAYTAVPNEPHARGEVWAGAMWKCRRTAGREAVDTELARAWMATSESGSGADFSARFGTALAGAKAPVGPCLAAEIEGRHLPRSPGHATGGKGKTGG